MNLSTLTLILAAAFAAFGWLPASTLKSAGEVFTNLTDSASASSSSPSAQMPPCVAWEYRATYPFPIAGGAAASDGTYAYVFGGSTDGHQVPDVMRYDPASNTWAPLEGLTYGNETNFRASYGGNGKIYVVGGVNNRSHNRIYDIASNTWSLGADLPIPLNLHSQVSWGGKIYVIGGISYPNTVASVFVYDTATNQWSPLAPMPQANFYTSAGVINGKIYVAGGAVNFPSNSLFIYDIASNTWSAGPAMPLPTQSAAGVVLNGKFMVPGGGDTTTTYNSNQVFDPATNSWSLGPALNEARRVPAGAVTLNTPRGETALIIGGQALGALLNSVEALPTICGEPTPTPTPTPTPSPDCVVWEYRSSYPLVLTDTAMASDGTSVYMFGGRTYQATTDAANRYDPASDTWTPLPSLPGGSEYRHFAEYGGNGKIYVLGGTNNGSVMRIYDIATNTWSTGGPNFANLIYASHAYSNGKIYITGGRSGGIVQSVLQAYDVAGNSWSTLATMPLGRFGSGFGIINGKLYVAGGTADGFNSQANVQIYDIATNTWSVGAPLPTPVKYPGSAVYGNELWVLGGSTTTEALKITQIYNPQTNSWRTGPNLIEPREGAGAGKVNTAAGEKMLIAGGVVIFSNLSASVEGSLPICPPSPTPTPTVTPTPVPTPTPPVPTPTIPVSPIVRDGSLDFGFSLVAGQAGSGEIDAIEPGPGDKIYVGGSFGSILGVPVKNVARLFQDGVVDQSFNVGSGANSLVRRVRVQPDGKVLASGAFTTFNGFARNFIVRLNTDGSVDQTFNVTSDASQLDVCDVQPDGRILVCGNFTTINGAPRKQVARLESSGSPDLSFDFGTGLPGSGSVRVIKTLADGKMLIGGNFSTVNGTPREGVARLNANGSVDTSYTLGTNMSFVQDIRATADGKILFTSIDHIVRAFPDGSIDPGFTTDNSLSTARFGMQLPDGKIMVGGDFRQVRVGTTTFFVRGLARLNSNGTIDLTFASPLTDSSSVQTGYLDPSGRLTIGGGFLTFGSYNPVGLARLNPDATRDVSFIGRLLARAIIETTLVEPNGKIMVGGSFDTLNSTPRNFVGRVNPDGSVDESFVPDVSIANGIQVIARQPDGKYIVGSFGAVNGRALWRLNPDGTLDTSFQLPTFNSGSFVLALAVQTDGKILVGGGFNTVNGSTRQSFARLNPDGSLDSLTADLGTLGPPRLDDFVIQSDGRIVLAGTFISVSGVNVRNIARLNLDGSIDQQFSANHGGSFGQVRSLTQIGGSLYVGSTLSITGINDSRFPLVKMSPDGTVDLSFNAGRLVGDVYAVAPLPNGKLLLGGTFGSFGAESGNRRSLVRILSNGGLDYTFDAGAIEGNNGPTSEAILALEILPGKKVLAAGAFNSIASQTRWCAARLNIDQNVTRAVSDFDGDGKTDISVFRPSNAAWYWLKSWNGEFRARVWGLATDKLVPADYDGDGITDISIFRPSEGRWYTLYSSSSILVATNWGNSTDVPAPGDFDGDGRADLTVYRDGVWWIDQTIGGIRTVGFGQAGDLPVVSDYDGDGKADTAIYRQAAGEWWLNRSSAGVIATAFGNGSDKPVPGDFTGDRKADVAFWRPSTGEWYVLRSEDYSYFAFPFGTNGDMVAPGDYDGDGKFDATVFRPASATWFVGRTTAGTQIVQFGANGDRPIPNAFVP